MGAGRGRSSRATISSGRIRATSTRHTSARPARCGARASLRSHSLTGASESRPFRGVGTRLRRGHSLALGPGQELLREPRLADAGVARHEREADPALGGPLPGLPQRLPLGLPAHERQGRGRRVAPCRGRLRAGRDVADPLVGADGVGTRLRVELAPQRGLALAIRLQRGRPVAAERQQPHQPAVRLLVERVVLQPVPDAGDRGRVLALLLEHGHERGRGALAAVCESLPHRSDPVVVAGGEQRTLAKVQRPLQAGAASRRVSRTTRRFGLRDGAVE